MLITYIAHSGFMAELDDVCLLFDYFKGDIPKTDKKLYVFASHTHQDHFNPKIFDIESSKGVTYILSKDIKTKRQGKNIIYLTSGEKVDIDGFTVETVKSTDCGVAFIVTIEGKTIFHAGDLNLWVWEEETKQYNNNMTANFNRYTKPLAGRDIDVAFIPLDPRLEATYGEGMDAFIRLCNIKKIFPMHFWNRYDVIDRYKRERPHNAGLIEKIDYEGQTWEV